MVNIIKISFEHHDRLFTSLNKDEQNKITDAIGKAIRKAYEGFSPKAEDNIVELTSCINNSGYFMDVKFVLDTCDGFSSKEI